MAKKKIEQTFVMSFEGTKYIPGVKKNGKFIALHKHIDPKFVTDKEAIEMLNIGALTPKDFKVLPDGYKNKQESKVKTLSIDDLETVLKNGEFNQMRAVAKELKLNTGKNPKSKTLEEAIEKVILKMIDEKED